MTWGVSSALTTLQSLMMKGGSALNTQYGFATAKACKFLLNKMMLICTQAMAQKSITSFTTLQYVHALL